MASVSAVAEEHGLVAAHGQRLFQHGLCLRRTHGHRHHRCAVLLLELQRRFDSVCVERVHDALHALAVEIAGLGVELDVCRIRNLFYEYKYLHAVCIPSGKTHFWASTVPPMTMRRISFVPSPISRSFASRTRRSTWKS